MSAAMKKVPSSRLPAQCRPITPKLGTSALTRPNHQSPSFLLSLLNCIVSQRRGGGGGSRWCYQCISQIFFFCCIAERAIKPCRSSRSKLRGEFGIPRHLQNRNQKHNKAKTGNKNTPKQQNQTTTQDKQKTKAGKCWNVKREVRRG